MALDPEIKDKLNSSLSGLGEVAKELLSYTGQKVKEVGLEAEKKARSIGRIAKLNSERTDAENKLLKDYAELGRYFYEQNEGNIPNEYAAFFDQIRLSAERLENVSRELGRQDENAEDNRLNLDPEISFEQRIFEIEKEMAARNGAESETEPEIEAPESDTADEEV